MKFFLLLFSLSYTICMSGQNNFSLVTCQVTDMETGLALKDVSVKIVEISKVFYSNESGTIKMALPDGTYRIVATHDNYQSTITTFAINNDTSITVSLKSFDKNILIEEVSVIENRTFKYNTMETGMEQLSSKTILALPVMAGEKDLVKSLALLPGMQTTGEGSANLVVRGGNPDQTLFLINGIPMYQTNHFFSMVSAINPQLIDHVVVYKSGFPAKYGGRVSSIIDMETKTPDNDSIHIEGDVGLISSKLVASIPIIKNKLAVMASIRRTYLDIVARPFKDDLGNVTFNFTDASFQANWKIDPLNAISLFNYYSRDNFMDIYKLETGREKTSNLNRWNNVISGMQWKFEKENFENQLKIGYSGYGMDIINETIKDTSYTEHSNFNSTLQNFLFSDQLNYKISERLDLNAGLQAERILVNPAEMNFENILEQYRQVRISESTMYSGAIWGSANYSHQKFKANLGIRESVYYTNQTNYSFFEPRINLLFEASTFSSIKASYGKSSQPLHLLSNNGLGRPVDLWLGSDSIRKPLVSNQWSLGFYKAFKWDNKDYEFSCETYFKTTDHLMSYRDGYSSSNFTTNNYLESNTFLNEILTYGKGIAYGLEILLEKKEGVFIGWLSYTLSKSRNQFMEFENGRWFNSPYDRPHNFAAVGNYQLRNRWELNFSFNLISGQPFTVPVAVYTQNRFDMLSSKALVYNTLPIYVNSERNGIRLKTFHKLDIGIKKQLKSRNNFNHWLELSVYNVYNRKNSTYGYVRDYTGTNEIKVNSVSLFPIMPSINYSFRF